MARRNDQVTTRKFRGISQIFFQATSASGSGNGTEGGFSIASALDAYQGSDFVSNNFEQYKVTNVEVLMKPSAATLEAPTDVAASLSYQNRVYSAMNQTYIQSFIDYDTDANPTFVECLQRPNLKTRALSPNNWTKVASFTPRTVSNQAAGNTAPTNTYNRHWMSTTNLDTKLFGFRGLGSNPCPVFDTQDNVMCIDTRVTVTVQMRGPKNASDSSAQLLIPLNCNKPRLELGCIARSPATLSPEDLVPEEPLLEAGTPEEMSAESPWDPLVRFCPDHVPNQIELASESCCF